MKKLISYKSLSRIAVPVVLVCAVAASLWFVSPSPAKALQIQITNPTSGTLGRTYSFQVKVSIEDNELLPIQNISLKIYHETESSTYFTEYTNLPLGSQASTAYTSANGTTTSASIQATADSMWGYSVNGTGNVTWQGYGYTFGTITGGYGYAFGIGTTSITYNIEWTSPSSWPTGDYKIDAKITSPDNQTFTKTSGSFRLSAPAVGGGWIAPPPAPAAIEVEPGVWDISRIITTEGTFTNDATLESADDKVTLSIVQNTVGKTKEGEALSQISLLEMEEPPAPPEGSNVIGLTYDLTPDEATFAPPITITFTYDPDEIPADFNEEDLVISIWDKTVWNEDTGEWGAWVDLEGSTVDPVTHTITAPISHFTPFAIIARVALPPAEEVVVPEEEEEIVIPEEEEEEVIPEEEEEEVIPEEEEEVVVPEEEEIVPEEEEEVLPKPIRWWLIGTIIASVVVIGGLLAYFFWWRRRILANYSVDE